MRAIVTAILLPALLTACTSGIRGPAPTEITAAQEGKESIVLLRLQVSIGGKAKRVLEPSLIERILRRRWALGLAAMDSYGTAEFTSPPRSPSSPAAGDGWVILSLRPGVYWVSIVPSDAWRSGPTAQGTYGYSMGGFVPAPAYLLEVRGREPVLYAGTLAFTQSEEATPRTAPPNQLGGGAIGQAPVVRTIDESDLAGSTLARELPELRSATMVTRLLRPYGSQLAPESIHALIPMGLGTLAAVGIGDPGWYQRPLMLWLTPAGVLMGIAMQGGGQGAGAVFALGLAYIPVGLFGGTVHGTIRKLRYDPCVDELTKRLREASPADWLWNPIADAFAAHLHEMPLDVGTDASGAPSNVRSVLLATVTRVQLHQVGSDVAVAVGLRARLWSVTERRWVYDRSFSYDPAGIPPARPYEEALPGTSPARALGDYCPPNGWTLVQGDLREATKLLIAQLRSDLGWKALAAAGEHGPGGEGASPGIAWVADLATASRLASEQGRPIVLYLSAIDCDHCARVEHDVHADPEFVEFSRRQIFVRRLREESEGKRLVERFAVRGFPTWLVLTPERRVVGRVEGFRDATTLIEYLQRIEAPSTP